MRFYVASRFGNYRQVRAICDRLRAMGHEITFDWTRTPEFNSAGEPVIAAKDMPHGQQLAYAFQDMEGATTCDRMILLCDPDMGGAYIEVGLAIPLDIRIYTVGERRFTIFWSLPNFMHFNHLEDLFNYLKLG